MRDMMNLFVKNVGDADRAVRLALAIVLVVAGIFLFSPPWTYVIFLVALIATLTAYTRSCGAYTVLGVSTMEKKAPSKARKK
jgi:hypothetical protein